ncbi:nucleoside triphosphate pyrophosphohydrolase [Methylocaldum szegediense]|uniref:Nucleoside triphosphate pyrophosphohydrolase n=1 Tax=Methylocaldum szegediense TaxID=73780 RepID=A0ABM9I3Y7_9GAMM|nr:nucleoside triphosphate pyrophosphohydrolase [Methylocaldum szegediense]CAI8877467.1 nucleoside triphosphate pyrophosphohydrolase [Methylocaldum szegediense]
MTNIQRLLDIMARLRHPETGCPWDLRQDFASLVPYTLEEAYEVADAAERGDAADLREELGDLLLQVVFHARIAEERGLFTFEDVAGAIADKLIRRHPHVFGDTVFETDTERHAYWESSKAAERREKGKTEQEESTLSGIAPNLPALVAAQKLQKRAARFGFDWPEIGPVFDKVREELDELEAARATSDQSRIQEEIGDLLFVVVNLARHLEVDAESALRNGNRKFVTRFRYIEKQLAAQGKTLDESTLAELDALWDEAKRSLSNGCQS